MAREPKPWIIYERSTNYGRSWEECEVSDRSPLYAELRSKRSHEVHDDGAGNLYRWRARGA